MTTPSFRDIEQLSAYLDDQLSPTDKAHLEARLQQDETLLSLLRDLRQARNALRHTANRPVPRNFTLTPRMAGIRPPTPRIVPLLSWASAVAALLFIFTLGSNLLGQLSLGAAAPMLAAAPRNSEGYGYGAGPVSSQPAAQDNALLTATAPAPALLAPGITTAPELRTVAPPAAAATSATKAQTNPLSIWLVIWPALAVLLLASALLIRWQIRLAFQRKWTKSIKK
jgi:anti-sigma factor RsiW